MSKLKEWIDAATKEEVKALATNAQTTVGNLRHYAGEYRPEYSMKAGLAGRVEAAAVALRKDNPNLPELTRADLCKDCAVCECALKK